MSTCCLFINTYDNLQIHVDVVFSEGSKKLASPNHHWIINWGIVVVKLPKQFWRKGINGYLTGYFASYYTPASVSIMRLIR